MTSRRPVLDLVFVAVFLAAAASPATPAAGGESALLHPGESVRGTLGSGGDRRVVAFAGVEGSTLDLRVGSPRRSLVVPTITVRSPGGAAVDVGDTNPGSGVRARVQGLVLGATGVWRIEVATPPARGGDFTLTARAKVPRSFSFTATADEAATVSSHEFPAAPGGRAEIAVDPPSRAATGLVVDLVAPSGAVVAHGERGPGRGVTLRAALPEIGRYTVRVTGVAGTHRATAVVRSAPRRKPSFEKVESRPDATGFSPEVTVNQQVLPLRLDGVGFNDAQTVSIVDGAAVLATGLVRPDGDASALADIDLAVVAPGTYSVRVSTPLGNTTTLPGTIALANRTPHVAEVSPGDTPNSGGFALTISGAGFDPGATVVLRRASDGTAIPASVSSRSGHVTIRLAASPAAHLTGPCDLEIRDPGGGVLVVPGAIDLLGFRSAPAVLRSYDSIGGGTSFPTSAAVDETRGRILVAVRETAVQAVFVLCDLATNQIVDTLVITPSDVGGFDHGIGLIRVAWDPVGDTFALCVSNNVAPAYGYVRIVAASDIRQTVSSARLTAAGTAHVNQLLPAANPVDGGYLVVWDEADAGTVASSIRARAIGPSGDLAASPVVVSGAPDLVQFSPTVAYQGSGKFVVAWSATDLDGMSPTVNATITDASGNDVLGGATSIVARASTWAVAGFPEIAVDPRSGDALVAFTYLEFTEYRSACVRLAAGDLVPGPLQTIDMGFGMSQGVANAAAWNPEREEFVVAAVSPSNRVVLRRVNADGTIRPAPLVESYEGVAAVLYAGSQPGSLGLARTFDGVADGFHDPLSAVKQVVAGPLR